MLYFRETRQTLLLRNAGLERNWVIGKKQLLPPNQENSFLACLNYQGLTEDRHQSRSTLQYAGVSEQNIRQTDFLPAHTVAAIRFTDDFRKLELSWNFRIFPKTPGWESFVEVSTLSFPLDDWRTDNRRDILDAIPFETGSASFHLASFRAGTDLHNEFVKLTSHKLKKGHELYLDGNILRAQKPDGSGLILVKVCPGPADRREKIRANFRITDNLITVLGWGIEPGEIATGKKITSHSLITIPFSGGETGATLALRNFLKKRWQVSFNSPAALIVNPWGGGGEYLYKHFSDKFIAREMEASAKLGATHYQIDDGWQAGGFLPDLTILGRVTDKSFWKIDRKKFPQGFDRIKQVARKTGVNIGLWFAPNVNEEYRNWKTESEILTAFHRKYGIDYIKIDGVYHRSREAEINLDNLLRTVYRQTGGKVRFNLDVTAGIRLGFLYSPEFGPVFPANRYPQSPQDCLRKYHPNNTLRNFWKLSHFIPPHLIQVEVPNFMFDPAEFGDPEKFSYRDNDPHSPLLYGGKYCAALSLFGSPLAWLQPSRTPKELLDEYAIVFAAYKEHRDSIVKGDVYPIGQEPDGKSITGFASILDRHGYAVIYREAGKISSARIPLPFSGSAKPETILSDTRTETKISGGKLEISLKDSRSFALLKW
jgi:hypothetical protein